MEQKTQIEELTSECYIDYHYAPMHIAMSVI